MVNLMAIAAPRAECSWWRQRHIGSKWQVFVWPSPQPSLRLGLGSYSTRFMRLDATMEQKKDKDDCVWCQKLHGLNLKGAKPKPLFFRKGRPPTLVESHLAKEFWCSTPTTEERRLVACIRLATCDSSNTKIFLTSPLLSFPQQIL